MTEVNDDDEMKEENDGFSVIMDLQTKHIENLVNELVSKEIKINQVEGVNRILEGKIEVFKSKEDINKEFLHEIFQKMDEINSTLKELRRQNSELQ